MSKGQVVKWYSRMLARLAFTTVMIAFYSAEVFNSVI